MKKVKLLFLLVLLLVLALINFRDSSEKIIVAGHTYSWPMSKRYKHTGLYEPFMEKYRIKYFFSNPDLLVLLGDMVWESSMLNWDYVDEDSKLLNDSVKYVFGNHDIGIGLETLQKRYGSTISFVRINDFTIGFYLDGNIDNWNLTGDQLKLVEDEISKNEYENVLLFIHQNIWWSPTNQHSKIKANSESLLGDSILFESELVPRLNNYKSTNFYLFTGDLGAKDPDNIYYSFDTNNVHVYASGMGNNVKGAFLEISIDEENVDVKPVFFGDNEEYSFVDKLIRKIM